jgi:hypothetical protein
MGGMHGTSFLGGADWCDRVLRLRGDSQQRRGHRDTHDAAEGMASVELTTIPVEEALLDRDIAVISGPDG